jgi:hypothetical protein
MAIERAHTAERENSQITAQTQKTSQHNVTCGIEAQQSEGAVQTIVSKETS